MQGTTLLHDLDPFAQVASIKLVKLLQGTLSVGLPSLVIGFPESRSFPYESFHVMDSLSSIGRPAGGAVAYYLAPIISSCKGIDPWLARPRWRGFFWDFAFHSRLLLTNRPRFHAQQRSRSTRRSSAPLNICKPKARLVEHAQMRRLPSRADAAGRSPKPNGRGRRSTRNSWRIRPSPCWAAGQVDGLEDLSQSGPTRAHRVAG